MKIAILGYGKEGKCAEKWLKKQCPAANFEIFDGFKTDELEEFGLEKFDLVVRTPSVSPHKIKRVTSNTEITSVTKIFFQHCPAQIIGITGTKGKGTTASMTHDLLKKIGKKVWLVGNIGTPALDVLDEISTEDIVVYELSSFQLWDLDQSPHIALVLRVEPDHLNVHDDYNDYVAAKSNITKWQKPDDFCIYYNQNADSKRIAEISNGKKIAYPVKDAALEKVVQSLAIVGEHNKENAEAAVLATAAALNVNLEKLLEKYSNELAESLSEFRGLPHRLEFVCKKGGVKYYDDSFSSAFPAMSVAIDTFRNQPTVIIAGGLDRGLDLTMAKQKLFGSENIKKVILIGETKEKLAKNENPAKYEIAQDLKDAVEKACNNAQKYQNSIVVLSPGAASFDMFKNFEERGREFQKIVMGM